VTDGDTSTVIFFVGSGMIPGEEITVGVVSITEEVTRPGG
jgi:hypothetical protein